MYHKDDLTTFRIMMLDGSVMDIKAAKIDVSSVGAFFYDTDSQLVLAVNWSHVVYIRRLDAK